MTIIDDFSSSFLNEADTEFTRKQMQKALTYNIQRKYKHFDVKNVKNITSEIMKTHGISTENLNSLSMFQTLINNNINDVSIDDNSNKNEKTIAGLFAEVNAPNKKIAGYDFLYRVMKEMYGKFRAKRLIGEMLDYSLGLSDSSNILIPYCYALDASKLNTIGRDFGVLPSKPCKRISSYISALCETVHQMSSHVAGAVAIGTFFFDIAHLAILKMNLTLEEVKTNKKCRKHFENEFQQLVHSFNHLSRNSNESPFTNLSIFGRSKIKHIIEHDLNWYFEKPESFESDKEWKKYVSDFVYELQMIFIDFFDKGDPVNNGLPYRFPVITINFAKKKVNNEWEIVDDKLLNDVLEKDIYRYNIFTSEGTKTASCCRMINDDEMLELAGQSNSFGAGALASLGSHRVVTINYNRIALEATSIDDFWRIYKYRIEGARDILKAHKMLINVLTDAKLQSFISNGWISLKRLFSTFGILGVYECALTMQKKFGVDPSVFKKEILTFLNKRVKRYSHEEKDNVFNVEQIPGESFAVRLAITDKTIFGEEEVPYELYANQFVPLWENANIFERLREDGKYNQLLSGGGIVHATIGETVSKAQAKQIITYAVKVGSEHFALNAVYSQCVNGHTNFGDHNICPDCGDEIKEKLSRTVGFFTPVSAWNKTRRTWEFPRRTKVDLSIKENGES